jgi:hypothetical protein
MYAAVYLGVHFDARLESPAIQEHACCDDMHSTPLLMSVWQCLQLLAHRLNLGGLLAGGLRLSGRRNLVTRT